MENLFILICELGPFAFIIAIHIGPQPFYNYREYFLRVSCGQNLPYKLACCLLFPFKLTVLIFFLEPSPSPPFLVLPTPTCELGNA